MQVLQLLPMRMFAGTTLPGAMIGPGQLVAAQAFPEESRTV